MQNMPETPLVGEDDCAKAHEEKGGKDQEMGQGPERQTVSPAGEGPQMQLPPEIMAFIQSQGISPLDAIGIIQKQGISPKAMAALFQPGEVGNASAEECSCGQTSDVQGQTQGCDANGGQPHMPSNGGCETGFQPGGQTMPGAFGQYSGTGNQPFPPQAAYGPMPGMQGPMPGSSHGSFCSCGDTGGQPVPPQAAYGPMPGMQGPAPGMPGPFPGSQGPMPGMYGQMPGNQGPMPGMPGPMPGPMPGQMSHPQGGTPFPGYSAPPSGYPHASPSGQAEQSCGGGPKHLKHDQNQYGQLMGIVNDFASGTPDVYRVMNFLETCDTQFWKGATIGVGLTLLLTNETVKKAVFGTLGSVVGSFRKDKEM